MISARRRLPAKSWPNSRGLSWLSRSSSATIRWPTFSSSGVISRGAGISARRRTSRNARSSSSSEMLSGPSTSSSTAGIPRR